MRVALVHLSLLSGAACGGGASLAPADDGTRRDGGGPRGDRDVNARADGPAPDAREDAGARADRLDGTARIDAAAGPVDGPPPDAATAPDGPSIAIGPVTIDAIGADRFTVHFTTTPPAAATVTVRLDPDRAGAPPIATRDESPAAAHVVVVDGLWSSAAVVVEVAAGGSRAEARATTADPAWPDPSCVAGDVAVPIDGAETWSVYTDVDGTAAVSTVEGCAGRGGAARFDFDLGSGEWVVAAMDPLPAPIDLTGATHLRVPFRGARGAADVALEIKLADASGALAVARLDGGTDLPVMRDWLVDLREFLPQTGAPDLSAVTAVQVGFSWPHGPGPRAGSVVIDDLQAFDVRRAVRVPAARERVAPDPATMAAIAADLLARQRPHGFPPSWFEESPPTFTLYTGALTAIVLAYEHARTGDPALAAGARLAADRLAALQALSDRGGAWDDAYAESGVDLVLRDEAARVVWVGSTAWAALALIVARDVFADGAYDDAIRAAADFYAARIACRDAAGLPAGSVTEGTEGNVSSQIFLDAAARRGLADASLADAVAGFIESALWDDAQGRLLCGVRVDLGGFDESACAPFGSGAIVGPVATACLDVAANWGSSFWLRRGRADRALRGFGFSRAIFPTRSFDGAVAGLGDIAGPWQPTVEFGAGQWAAAGGPDSAFVLRQAIAALADGGAVRGAPDDFAAGIGWNTSWHGVAPAAWVYLALRGDFPAGL